MMKMELKQEFLSSGEHDEPVGGEYDKRKNCITKLRAGDEPACEPEGRARRPLPAERAAEGRPLLVMMMMMMMMMMVINNV